MINFLNLNDEEIVNLYKFVKNDLSVKYDMEFNIEETKIVDGMIGNDKIKEALIIKFLPKESKINFIEDKIITDIHKYLFENNLLNKLNRKSVINRDVYLNQIRYGIIYCSN